MSQERFSNLIAQLYKTFGEETTNVTDNNYHLNVNGIAFSLIYMNEMNDSIYIYADFDPIPEDVEVQMMSQFLITNFFLSSQESPGFGLHPVTGQVLFMHRIPLADLSVEGLLNLLKNLSKLIKTKQESIRIAKAQGDNNIFLNLHTA